MVDDRVIHWRPHGEDLYVNIYVEDEEGRADTYTYKLSVSKKTHKARCRLIYVREKEK